jgi:hypothetical protein
VATAILSSERRGRLTDPDIETFLALLRAMPVMVDEATSLQAWTTTLALAREFRLSSYDASYLELALRRGLAVATTPCDYKTLHVSLTFSLFRSSSQAERISQSQSRFNPLDILNCCDR